MSALSTRFSVASQREVAMEAIGVYARRVERSLAGASVTSGIGVCGTLGDCAGADCLRRVCERTVTVASSVSNVRCVTLNAATCFSSDSQRQL
jgi:hypothetical protein